MNDCKWPPKPSEPPPEPEAERIDPNHPERPRFGFSLAPNVVIKDFATKHDQIQGNNAQGNNA